MGLFNLFKKKKSIQSETSKIDVSQQRMISGTTRYAELFVENYNPQLENTLDFSLQSVKGIDYLLDDLHSNAEKWDDTLQKSLLVEAGSYYFELVRREFGGKYGRDFELDQATLTITNSDSEVSITVFDKLANYMEKKVENGMSNDLIQLQKSLNKYH